MQQKKIIIIINNKFTVGKFNADIECLQLSLIEFSSFTSVGAHAPVMEVQIFLIAYNYYYGAVVHIWCFCVYNTMIIKFLRSMLIWSVSFVVYLRSPSTASTGSTYYYIGVYKMIKLTYFLYVYMLCKTASISK